MCARLVDQVEARTAAENAVIVERSTDSRQRQWVKSLGDGGFMTWRSSPFVMWWLHRLEILGDGLEAVVDDDLEEWNRHIEERNAPR